MIFFIATMCQSCTISYSHEKPDAYQEAQPNTLKDAYGSYHPFTINFKKNLQATKNLILTKLS